MERSITIASNSTRTDPSGADLTALMESFGVPEFLCDYVDRFFEAADVTLVRALSGGSLRPEALRALDPRFGVEGIERARRRGIVDFGPNGTVGLADFHARFEVWALFEGWKDVPDEIREALNQWELEYYIDCERATMEALRAGGEGAAGVEVEDYLLLHEAEALIDRAPHVYLWPCNCRAMMGKCAKPMNTCLRFTNDRGIGWEVSAERAKAIVREANAVGLMQTGGLNEVDGRVTGAICNCCTDCCYPHIAADRLGLEKLWPRSRYVARRVPEACTACGRCARRCPFGAFVAETRHSPDTGAALIQISFVEGLCRGCGVCATACTEGAIIMDPLVEVEGTRGAVT